MVKKFMSLIGITKEKSPAAGVTVAAIFTAAAMMFLSSIAADSLLATDLVVRVRNSDGTPLSGGMVTIAGIPIGSTTGDPDPSTFLRHSVGADGLVTFNNLLPDHDYMVAVEQENYGPTAREQIFNPQFMPIRVPAVNPPSTISIDRYMNLMPVDRRGGKLSFNITNIPADLVNKTIVMDIRNAQTDAPVAMQFTLASGPDITADVYNVPPASTGSYRASIIAMANPPRATDIVVNASLESGKTLLVPVDFSSASAVVKTGDQPTGTTGTSVRPAFSGVVWSTGTNPSDVGPLSDARVMLYRKRDDTSLWDFRDAQKVAETRTDVGGNFAFYNISAGTYAVQTDKEGYLGIWDQNQFGGGAYIYDGSGNYTIPLPRYDLQRGLGRIKGRVLAYDQNVGNNVGVANAYVRVDGIFDSWPVSDNAGYDNYYTTGSLRAGRGWGYTTTDQNGYFDITGIGEGNFNLYVYSEMRNGEYRFVDGANQQSDWAQDPVNNWYSRSGDDLRIQVTPHISSRTWCVYDAAGNKVSYPLHEGDSPIVDVVIATISYRTGTISGKIIFKDFEKYPELSDYSGGTYKVKISSTDPVTIYALEATNSWPRKIYSWTYSTTGALPSVDYTLNVATGTAYYLWVKSTRWGVLNQTDMMCNLVSNSTITDKNITLVPSGQMRIVVKDKNGNVIKRTHQDLGPGQWVDRSINYMITGPSRRSDSNDQDVWYGLVPGIYKVMVEYRESYNSGSSVPLAPAAEADNIVVSAGRETYVEITLKPGARIIPSGASLAMPPLGATIPGFYAIAGFKSGIILNSKVLSKTLFSAGSDERNSAFIGLSYMNGVWESKMAPDGKYDFYLGFANIFNPGGPDMPINFHQSFTVFAPLKDVNIKYDETVADGATTYLNFGAGTLGNAAVTGKLRGTKFFTAEDVAKIKEAGFNKFFEYIPTVMIYDNQGNFKGFSAAMPKAERMPAWNSAVGENVGNLSYDWVSKELSDYPLEYWCEKLPAGKYTLVFEHPNYPPMTKQVELTSGLNTFDFNMDESKITGISISGVVKSTDGVALMGALVKVNNRNASIEKEAQTDNNGAFKIQGLVPGIYRIDVSRPDYANGGDKVSAGKDGLDNIEIKLNRADAAISGTVYTQRFPAKFGSGARVIAYSETENTANPGKYLAVYKTVADKNGAYRIPGLVSGQKYKIYCVLSGYNFMWRDEENVAAGENTGRDFFLTPTKPRLQVQFKKILENKNISYNLLITCPSKLINPQNPNLVAAPYCRYSAVSKIDDPFDPDKATELLVVPGPNNTYSATFQTPSESKYFKMRILATDGVNDYYEDVVFGPQIDVKVKKDVTSELAEGGQIEIDSTGGDTTKLGLDAGAITPASVEITSAAVGNSVLPIGGFLSSLPNFNLSRTQSAVSLAMQKLVDSIVASEVYEIKLDQAQLNRDVTLTLNYDREKVGADEIQNLKIGKYNDSTGEWELVKGTVVSDPLSGTVSVDVGSIGSAQGAPVQKAVVKDGKFAINKAASTSQSGVYAVFTQDPASVKAYAGTGFEIMNFPNPFDMKSKTVTLTDVNSGNSQTITGTMIKYSLPASVGAKAGIKFYIYNLAGELVRTLDLGEKDGGYYYYTEWDGKNDSGQDCASGVYFLIAKKGNDKLNSKPLKMAIVK